MALTQITTKSIKDGDIVNADINASAAIAKSKLASLDIANADVNSSAAIAGSKISPDFGSQNITTTGNIDCASDTNKVRLGASQDFTFEHNGTINKILSAANRLIISGSSADNVDIMHTQTEYMAEFIPNGAVNLYHDNSKKFETTSAGVTVTGNATATGTISDSKGNVRSIPLNSQSSAYTLVAADAGKVVYISSGGVTINENVFSAGDAVTIINNSGSNQTLTEGSGNMALYNTADGTTGNRTLAGRGMCTLYWATASNAYISGAGLT